jgi:CDGSH-type Zn-finger protein
VICWEKGSELFSSNGPLVVQGKVRLSDGDGRLAQAPEKAIALCRCGKSAKGLMCDGTHNDVGFCAEEFDLLVDPLPVTVSEGRL